MSRMIKIERLITDHKANCLKEPTELTLSNGIVKELCEELNIDSFNITELFGIPVKLVPNPDGIDWMSIR